MRAASWVCRGSGRRRNDEEDALVVRFVDESNKDVLRLQPTAWFPSLLRRRSIRDDIIAFVSICVCFCIVMIQPKEATVRQKPNRNLDCNTPFERTANVVYFCAVVVNYNQPALFFLQKRGTIPITCLLGKSDSENYLYVIILTILE